MAVMFGDMTVLSTIWHVFSSLSTVELNVNQPWNVSVTVRFLLSYRYCKIIEDWITLSRHIGACDWCSLTNLIMPLTSDLRVDFGVLHCFLKHLYPNHFPHPLQETERQCQQSKCIFLCHTLPDGLIHTVAVIRVVVYIISISVYFLNWNVTDPNPGISLKCNSSLKGVPVAARSSGSRSPCWPVPAGQKQGDARPQRTAQPCPGDRETTVNIYRR